MSMLLLVLTILGSVCVLGVLAVGVCALAALFLGAEDEDPEDEQRLYECERMARALQRRV